MIRKELRGSHDSASGGFRRFFFGDAGTRPLMEEFLVDKPPRVADLFFRDHNLFFFPRKKGFNIETHISAGCLFIFQGFFVDFLRNILGFLLWHGLGSKAMIRF